jgi:hypothetical protein
MSEQRRQARDGLIKAMAELRTTVNQTKSFEAKLETALHQINDGNAKALALEQRFPGVLQLCAELVESLKTSQQGGRSNPATPAPASTGPPQSGASTELSRDPLNLAEYICRAVKQLYTELSAATVCLKTAHEQVDRLDDDITYLRRQAVGTESDLKEAVTLAAVALNPAEDNDNDDDDENDDD